MIHFNYSYRENIKKVFFDISTSAPYKFVRHLIAGGIGTLLYIGFIAFFVEIIHYHPVTAAVISTFLNALYTYLIQRSWVYNSSASHLRAIPKFLAVGFVAIGMNSTIMYLVVEVFNWWYGFGVVCAAAIVPPTNFLLNYYWTYK